MRRPLQFVTGLFLLLLVVGFSLKLKIFFGWAPDLVLAALVAFGMIFEFYEMVILTCIAVWILNWQPWPGPELAVLAALALLSFTGRFFMPWQRWVSILVLTSGGILALYLSGAPEVITSNPGLILGDATLSAAFAFLTVYAFRIFYPRVSKTGFKRL